MNYLCTDSSYFQGYFQLEPSNKKVYLVNPEYTMLNLTNIRNKLRIFGRCEWEIIILNILSNACSSSKNQADVSELFGLSLYDKYGHLTAESVSNLLFDSIFEKQSETNTEMSVVCKLWVVKKKIFLFSLKRVFLFWRFPYASCVIMYL